MTIVGWRPLAWPVSKPMAATVRENLETGELACECPSFLKDRTLCEHIQAVYQDNLDGRTPEGGSRPLNSQVDVILFAFPPTRVQIQIGMKDEQGDREAHLVMSDCQRFTQFLGYVRDGEGRRVLRSMVIDFITGQFLDGLTCDSPHHYDGGGKSFAGVVPTREPIDRQDPKNPVNLVNALSILRVGTCAECAELAIPDVPPVTRWSR